MILKRYKADPQPGDVKTVNHFAWLPTRVNDTLIWLEWYNKQVEYTATKHINMGTVEWPCIHIQEEGWSFINESRGKHRGYRPQTEAPIPPPIKYANDGNGPREVVYIPETSSERFWLKS